MIHILISGVRPWVCVPEGGDGQKDATSQQEGSRAPLIDLGALAKQNARAQTANAVTVKFNSWSMSLCLGP
jgi:hypothetical protein